MGRDIEPSQIPTHGLQLNAYVPVYSTPAYIFGLPNLGILVNAIKCLFFFTLLNLLHTLVVPYGTTMLPTHWKKGNLSFDSIKVLFCSQS
jgi:hypothetical protein